MFFSTGHQYYKVVKNLIMDNWLSRTQLLFDPETMQRMKESSVLIVGLGGVGAFAAEMICRAGIGNMTIVDGDVVSESNRNRQLPALSSTTGRPKAQIMGERLLDINPALNVTVINIRLSVQWVPGGSLTRHG